MNWEKYEELTKYIYAELGKNTDIKILGYGRNCKVEGESGVEHQVDVLTEHQIEGVSFKTAIECKYHNTNISKDPIMKLAQILDDCNIKYGVIVAKKGFTPDAIKFAKYKNISLVELRKPEDRDWAGRARDMTSIIKLYNPLTFDINLFADTTSDSVLQMDNSVVKYSNGTEVSLFNLMENKCQEVSWSHHEITSASIDFPSDTCLFVDGNKCAERLTKIEFKIKAVLDGETRSEFKGDDLVSFYMNVIFENRSLHIRNDGSIKELQ